MGNLTSDFKVRCPEDSNASLVVRARQYGSRYLALQRIHGSRFVESGGRRGFFACACLRPRPSYGLTVNETALEPWAPHEFVFVASADPKATPAVPLAGLYT
jgi:hypothetical protein